MRVPQLLLTAAVAAPLGFAAHAAPQTPYDRLMAPFLAELDRQCPGRNLQNLSHGDLNLVMEGFHDELAPSDRSVVDREVDKSCKGSIAGLSCANAGALVGYQERGLMPRFVTKLCATAWRCRGFADCAQGLP